MHKMLIGIVLGPLIFSAAHAEPIKLKFSFVSSDRSNAYLVAAKPFVDAMNAEGADRIQIEPYFSGRISPVPAEQSTAVADGRADLAVIFPSYSPERFPGIDVLLLPGLFRDAGEASYVFRHLLDSGALSGFEDFIVLGAVVGPTEIINSRRKTDSLADLKGQTIRVNNPLQEDTLRRLGAAPVLLPLKAAMDSLGQGKIDGATSPPFLLFEYGIGRLASRHLVIEVGGVPAALVMKRQTLENLSPQDQALIRKYSGEWLEKRSATYALAMNKDVLAQLRADPLRSVVVPSAADTAESQRVFNSVAENWSQAQPRNRDLLRLAREAIADYRKSY